MIKKYITVSSFIFLPFIHMSDAVYAQGPHRVGTTTANFLEIGFGAAGIAMGDAYVSVVKDLSAVYWKFIGMHTSLLV